MKKREVLQLANYATQNSKSSKNHDRETICLQQAKPISSYNSDFTQIELLLNAAPLQRTKLTDIKDHARGQSESSPCHKDVKERHVRLKPSQMAYNQFSRFVTMRENAYLDKIQLFSHCHVS